MDDARFEALVVRQNRQAVLEEARQKANGKIKKKKKQLKSMILPVHFLSCTICSMFFFVPLYFEIFFSDESSDGSTNAEQTELEATGKLSRR